MRQLNGSVPVRERMKSSKETMRENKLFACMSEKLSQFFH